MYRYTFQHPVVRSAFFAVGLVSATGIISSLTHGLRYEGSIPLFFYIAMVMQFVMVGFSATLSDGILKHKWFGITFWTSALNEPTWEPEGRLWRLHNKNRPTTILTTDKAAI